MLTKVLKAFVVCAVLLTLSAGSVAADPGYNRAAARNYADAHCRNYNPKYICYQNDCQNFLSQVLNAGALPQLWGANPSDHTGWWFTSCNDASETWYNSTYFDHHCQLWNGVRFALRPSFYYLGAGDPILANFPGGWAWDHSAVYMSEGIAWDGSKQGQYCQLRSQHTEDRCRVWVLDFYPPETQFRLWTVIW